jgi:signal recognition particle receptor subunit beta
VQLKVASRELALKLVYYGPGLSGKTTNLMALHGRLSSEQQAQLMTLDTADDRTLFFDMLPLRVASESSDFAVRIKLYTVPGQPIHATTRRMVLAGADGVAFIADSRSSQIQANAESFRELRANLKVNGFEVREMPLVIQFNKRDLPDVRTDDQLRALARRGREPVYGAVATEARGVAETFLALLKLVWRDLDKRHQISEKLQISERAVMRGTARQLGFEQLDELSELDYSHGTRHREATP